MQYVEVANATSEKFNVSRSVITLFHDRVFTTKLLAPDIYWISDVY